MELYGTNEFKYSKYLMGLLYITYEITVDRKLKYSILGSGCLFCIRNLLFRRMFFKDSIDFFPKNRYSIR